MKINCWEFKGCGKEPRGNNVSSLGVCPASVEIRANGIHGGINSGRCCWSTATKAVKFGFIPMLITTYMYFFIVIDTG